MRTDGRKNGEIREIEIKTGFTMYAEGSVLYRQGNTVVLCNASVEDRVPPHVFGTGKGWVTAEYSMLPRATSTRNRRDVTQLKLSPRSTEIQRLVARSLRVSPSTATFCRLTAAPAAPPSPAAISRSRLR